MERALVFTTDKLITSVTPRAIGSELALSRKNRKPLHPRSNGVQGGFCSAQSNAKKLPIFFSKWAQASLGKSARQYYSSKQLREKLCLVAIKSYRLFDLIFKKKNMVRKDSEAYSIFEGIYVFLVLFPIFISYFPIVFTGSFLQDMQYFRYLRKDPSQNST